MEGSMRRTIGGVHGKSPEGVHEGSYGEDLVRDHFWGRMDVLPGVPGSGDLRKIFYTVEGHGNFVYGCGYLRVI